MIIPNILPNVVKIFIMTANKRGGKRNGAGRKPIKDKKIPLTIYIKKSTIAEIGGRDKARKLATNVLEKL